MHPLSPGKLDLDSVFRLIAQYEALDWNDSLVGLAGELVEMPIRYTVTLYDVNNEAQRLPFGSVVDLPFRTMIELLRGSSLPEGWQRIVISVPGMDLPELLTLYPSTPELVQQTTLQDDRRD